MSNHAPARTDLAGGSRAGLPWLTPQKGSRDSPETRTSESAVEGWQGPETHRRVCTEFAGGSKDVSAADHGAVAGLSRIFSVENGRPPCARNLVTAKAVGSGHFLSLEVPEQINPMTDRFISLYVQGRG